MAGNLGGGMGKGITDDGTEGEDVAEAQSTGWLTTTRFPGIQFLARGNRLADSESKRGCGHVKVSRNVSERLCEQLMERHSRNMGLNVEVHLETCEGETRLVDLDLSGWFRLGTDENGTGDERWTLRWPGGWEMRCGEECHLECRKVGIPEGKKGSEKTTWTRCCKFHGIVMLAPSKVSTLNTIFEGNGYNGMSIPEPGNDFLQWC
ncbi:hypothetical protein DL96DRAFT_1561912 [Flagelloscypha sp. PMI_526]|nr:hypothetical protein DL96DRAFT_1561912 [Flagelloscypha sp. PMI_526]